MAGETNLVCISRAAGAGGEEIGWAVAQQLGLPYVDEQIIDLAAERAGVDPDVMAEAEAQKSLVTRVVEAMDSLGALAMHPSRLARPSRRSLRALIRDTLGQVAERGPAVIVAHAASVALGPRSDILRVLVTGSPKARADRLHALGISSKDAMATIEESDRSRQQYLRSFYGVSEEGPMHYDLVINTDRLGVEGGVAAILAALGR
jgi:cytidylate kinase